MNIPAIEDATSDEKLWATFCHGSVILFWLGIILPLVAWVTQRDKSPFVAFHALQALAFQLLQMVYWIVITIVAVVLMIGSVVGIAIIEAEAGGSSGEPPAAFLFAQFLFMGLFFCGFGVYALFGIVGAVMTITGRDFRYPILGKRLERYLVNDPNPTPAEVAS